MKSDKYGTSTCAMGQEQFERYDYNGKTYTQYDYKDKFGALFSCVKPTLEECLENRDKWLKKQ